MSSLRTHFNHSAGQKRHFLLHVLQAVLHCLVMAILVISILPVLPAGAAGIIYVDAAALGGNTGASWANAYTSLQTALTASAAGTIWIAQGTYKPTTTTDRTSTFTVKPSMALYGGFPAGGGDGTFAARDPQRYPTILSGGIGTGAITDNSYHVVTLNTADATTLLDGLTIREGNASGSSGSTSMGGGLYLAGGSPIFRSLRFEESQSETQGGGMYIGQGNPTLDQVTFANNRVVSTAFQYQGLGGGLFVGGGSQATLQNVTFSGNYSHAFGGGMAIAGSSAPLLDSVRFEANLADHDGAGLYIKTSSPLLRNVVFENNQTSADGGGLEVETQGSPTLVNVHFTRNKAGSGAALTVYQASASLVNTTFLGNTATYGGGIFTWNGSVNLQNAIFVGNTAVRRTSTSGDYGGWGGGIESEYNSTVYIRNVSFSNNQAYSGKAIYCDSSYNGGHYLYNSILWDAYGEISCPGYTDSHSLIQIYQTPDPLFVQTPAPGTDGTWGTADDQYGDLRVQPASPAINGGDVSLLASDSHDLDADGDKAEKVPFDLASAPRITGAAVDIGAYETANHAPLISGMLTLPDILEDAPAPAGAKVRNLLNGFASDVDGNDLGIAVVYSEPYNGDWQYSLDGVTWVTIQNVLTNYTATLLGPDTWLRFIPYQNYNGRADLEVRAWDQTDGRAPGANHVDVWVNGQATAYSAEKSTLRVQVISVNDAPFFTAGPDQAVLEDAGALVVSGWATKIESGPKDEMPQPHTFLVSSDTPGLFAVQPAVAANGTLSFTPAADASGAAVVTVRLQDDGGIANDGVDTSPPQTFTITVAPVNDAPSFVKSADPAILQDSGAHVIPGWAAQIFPGPTDEAGQALAFRLTTSNDALFAALPGLTPAGDLTFTPAAQAYGSATVTVTLQDDGGVANGGADTSQPQIFTITVAPLADTAITLGASPNPAAYHQTVTLTSQVTGQALGAPPVPTGTVTFKEGSTVLGTASLQPAGGGTTVQAVFTISTLAAGEHILTAVYTGDSAYHDVTTSPPLRMTINRASAAVTLSELTQTYTGQLISAQASTSPSGLPVRLTYNGSTAAPLQADSYAVTAEITDSNYTGSATDTLTIQPVVLNVKADDLTRVYGADVPLSCTYTGFVNHETEAVLSGGPYLATSAGRYSPPGLYPITIGLGKLSAQNYTFTFTEGSLRIEKASASASLELSAGAVEFSQPVTLTITVSPAAPSTGAPTGSITLLDGPEALDTLPLIAGKAALTLSSLSAGSHALAVRYSGDDHFQPSTSAVQTLVVGVAADLSLSLSASADYASPWADLVYTLTVTNQGPSPATQVILTDTLPDGLTLKTVPAGCTQAGRKVTCPLDTLASGGSVSLRFTLSVPLAASGDLLNTAQVSAKEPDPLDSNSHASLPLPVSKHQLYIPIIKNQEE